MKSLTLLRLKDALAIVCSGLFFIPFSTSALAADFSGKLKGATITDAQAVNKPPVSVFTYSQNGQTIFFDAGGSSDPDGSITKYTWDFGDGKVAEGKTASYELAGGAPFKVTLTVVDNNSGAALSQQTVTPTTAGAGIHDDFSTDTTANYTVMGGKALNVTGGVLRTSTWSTTVAYHKTSLGKNDHSVEADVMYNAELGAGGLLARFDPTQKTGYLIWFESGRVTINKYANGTITYLALYDGKYTTGAYKLKVTTTGQTITVAVNGTVVLSKIDTSFANGNYVGVILRAAENPSPITLDNFSAN